MVLVQRRLTLEEFLELPEEEPALEFVEGEVTQKVSPQGEHSTLQYAVAEIFNRFERPRKLVRAFTELRARFSGAAPVPDVSVYRWDRIPRTPSGRVANVFTEPPDIAIEIVSPSQRVNALVRRCLWYVRHGVRIALLIDPDDESIILFRPDTLPRALRGADPIDLNEVVPGLELTVADIFATLTLE